MLLLQLNGAGTMAADTTASGGAGEISLSMFDLALQGGWVMAVLAVLWIIAIYIFFERFFLIVRASREDKNFMNNIRDFIHEGKVDAALGLCKSKNSPIARMIEKGVMRLGKPLGDIQASIENVGKLEVAKLEKNIAGLATVAGAGPMLGFLGTVLGMIQAFYDMSMAGNNVDIIVLSSGIYEAMVTTVAGLIVGIVAYVCHNVLVARIEKMVFLLEARATEFMDLLNEPAS